MKYVYRRYPAHKDRNQTATPLKDAIQQMFQSVKLDEKYNNAIVVSSWSDVMGKTIAMRTSRIFMKKKTLYVEVSSAPLKSELRHHREKVISLLNKHVGKNAVAELVLL